ncbi:MAG: dppC [Jatrophihabitantaceae bacterium]|nr:dppC [Jatrophihabitantaceae bacterium]
MTANAIESTSSTLPTGGPRAEAEAPRRRNPLPKGWWMVIPPLLLVILAVVGKYLVPWDPERVAGPSSTAPNGQYWFGTDSSGLDVFSRVIVATRINLTIALIVSLLATSGGIILGLGIGMNESRRGPVGWTARGLARVIDLIQAVPAVLVGLVVVAFYGASTTSLTLALSVILAPIQLRLVRTEVLRVRGEAYVDAARMAGLSERRLTVRHVLPNSSWAALENTSVIFAVSVILTAALGFIGVGLPPPTPEWGAMLSRGATDAIVGRWWSAAFPTLALAITVASFAGLTRLLFHRRVH